MGINILLWHISFLCSSYRSCYEYTVDGGKCNIVPPPSNNYAEVVKNISAQTKPVDGTNHTAYHVTTPTGSDKNYPPNTVCFYRVGNRLVWKC